MARVETIISSAGGIGAAAPFVVGFIPFISQATPPFISSTGVLLRVAGPPEAIALSTAGTDPVPAATEIFRVLGGIISKGSGTNSTVLGRAAVGSATRAMGIGDAAAASIQDGLAVGSTAIASDNAGNTAVGSGAQATGGGGASAFGSSAIANGRAVAIGNSCAANDTGGNSSAAIGRSCSTGTGDNSVCVGVDSSISSVTNAVAVGCQILISAAGAGAVAIGMNNGGRTTEVSAVQGIAIGQGVQVDANHSIGIGVGHGITHADCITIGGFREDSFAANVFNVGGGSSVINTMIVGGGNTKVGGQALTFRLSDGSGADNQAGNLTIRPGLSTGAAASATIIFQTGTVAASSSTVQTAATRLTLSDTQVLLDATVQLVVSQDRGARFNNQTSAAAAQVGTLTNSPAAGNPAHWLKISVGGVNHAIPCWLG